MTSAISVHPFPARMAPELALKRLPLLVPGDRSVVLDPMMGSGTIPVLAAMQGYSAIGVDSDPLAVVIARTNGRMLDGDRYLAAAERITADSSTRSMLAFSHSDRETQDFIDYWFDRDTQARLGALATGIQEESEDLQDPLWCAFSRLIITKDAGASRARDVSHSRPHRVREMASFDPVGRYLVSARAVLERHRKLARRRPPGQRLRLFRGDARNLGMASESVDIVMTSPPYLQAIDYLRGHRMSLVWMGHTIRELRELRSASIGSERMGELADAFQGVVPKRTAGRFGRRGKGILERYASDLGAVMLEIARVLKPEGEATLIVADATLEGEKVPIAGLVARVAKRSGLEPIDKSRRSLPRGSRYLPPPSVGGSNSLDRRMKIEHRLTFRKPS